MCLPGCRHCEALRLAESKCPAWFPTVEELTSAARAAKAQTASPHERVAREELFRELREVAARGILHRSGGGSVKAELSARDRELLPVVAGMRAWLTGETTAWGMVACGARADVQPCTVNEKGRPERRTTRSSLFGPAPRDGVGQSFPEVLP